MASILIWFVTNYPQSGPWEEPFVQAEQTVQAQFDKDMTEKVFTPLNIKGIEENPEFLAQIEAVTQKRDLALKAEEPEEIVLEKIIPDSPLKDQTLQYFNLKDGLDEKLGEIHVAKSAAQLENSYAGRMGKGIEPIIKPLGFDWKIGVGLVGAFAAKEILVSTLGIIYSVEGADEEPLPLQEILANDPSFSPLIAICLMVFSLLYCPCLAVIGVIKRETKSFKWPIIAMVYPTVLAWFVTFAIYQGGRALGF